MATKEAQVLSAVCRNRDIHVILGEDDALFGSYGDVFEFVRGHYLRHKDVPSILLINERFPDVELPDTDAPTQYYLEGLKSEFITNRMGGLLEKAATALDDTTPPAQVLEKLQTALAKLGRYTAQARDLDITDGEAAEEYFQRLRKVSEEKGGIPGISTGFKSIDSVYTTGMSGGHFVVLMGYTGRTKTMWSELLAANVWAQGYKPMIISLEMTPEEQRERLYALMNAGVFSISDLSRGAVSMDDFGTFRRNKLEANAKGFVVVSSEGFSEVTPNTIQAKIDMHKPDIVFLDYLQLMKDNAKTQAMTPRMLNLSRECKMLATANGIPVVAITAVTDEDGDKRDAPPVLSQISWSSGIEFDANLAIAIHLHDDSNLVEVVGRKNRHGPLFDFYFEVDLDRGIWNEKFNL